MISNRLLRIGCVAGMALVMLPASALAQYGTKTQADKVVHFHLRGALTETPREVPFAFGSNSTISLKDLLERLSRARDDSAVKAVAITYSGMGMGAGQLEELRNELLKFKAVNKRVFVHLEGMSLALYALFSSASDLSVVPTADLWLTGIYGEQPYLKDMLDKIGVEADILQMGDYKAAGETMTRSGPSKAASDNVEWLYDGIYTSLIDMITDARGLTADRVRQLIDDGPYTPQKAKKVGLIDAVQYRDEFVAQIKDVYGDDIAIDNRYGEKKGPDIDLSNPFAFFSVLQKMLSPAEQTTRDAIGIVYVEGTIVTGHAQQSPFGGSSGAFSGDIRNALDAAADDDSIKAVVLRVDSPGGSALASEIILRSVQRLQKKKPLIVSMGNVAGSGGYYVACSADAILADETTITASIGVVGGKVVTAGLWDWVGVNWVPVRRGANADLMNSARRFDDDQRKRIHGWMNEIYTVFKDHVVAGRGDKLQKPIDQLAGGRVFTGKQALELGLVDKIGGLSDAVEFAARKASIGDYDVRVVPEQKNFLDMIFQEMSGEGRRPSDVTTTGPIRLLGTRQPMAEALLPLLQHLDPQRTKALMRGLERLDLIRKETVIMMMPTDFVIR